MFMSVIKKSDLKAMSAKEAEAKIAELEKAILEMHGEGKREKIAPLKKAIAQLRTKLAYGPAPKDGEKKEEAPKKEEEKPKVEEKPKEEKPKA